MGPWQASERWGARRAPRRRGAWALVLACACVGAAPGGVAAAAGGADPADAGAQPPWYRSRQLVGDPAGARTRLGRLGFAFQLFYNEALAWKPHGGADPDDSFGHSGSYDLFTLVDLDELAGWRGLALLAHMKGQYDRNVNDDVRALSDPIDDADPDDPAYLSELWLGKALLASRLELRGGLLEQQSVFDRNACANSEDQQFMSTFLDNDPLVPLPNGPGAVLIAAPFAWLDVAAGAVAAALGPRRTGFAGSFEDLDGVVGQLELGFRVRLGGARALPGSYRLGAFVDGRQRPVFGESDPVTGAPSFERGHPGVYASFDQLAFREAPESEQGLSLFARLGWADPDTSPVAWFWSLGLQYRGLLPGRDEDVLGLGSYQAIGSGDLRRAGDARFDRETGVELYYRIGLLPWLALTPDVQYVVDPGATGRDADAVVAALRFRMSF